MPPSGFQRHGLRPGCAVVPALKACAHRLIAELLQAGKFPHREETVRAADDSGMMVTITISLVNGATNCPPGTPVGAPTVPLREIERCILEAAPGSDGAPVSVKALSRLAGYQCSSYFREAVRGLIDRGLLARFTNGVRRCK